MVFFIDAHLLKNCPGLFVLGRQLLQMFVQVLADLMLGRRYETKADLVADQPGNRADTERHAVKQWIQHAGVAAQLMDALFTPDQMIDLFFSRVLHGCAYLRQLGGQRLSLIQRLGADFAGMVDAHQTGDMAGVFVAHLGFRLQNRR